MSRYKSKDEINTKQDKQDSAWEVLIHNAEAQIKAAKTTVTRLRKSIRFFEKQRASGKPFPLEQK